VSAGLSWSEAELPQAQRTKHVHGLHPYLGKFPPQVAEVLLREHIPARGVVLDPFAGRGRLWRPRPSSASKASASRSPPSTACWCA
jgi:hypothetical protein